jgi:hypothetical protein
MNLRIFGAARRGMNIVRRLAAVTIVVAAAYLAPP